VEASQVRYLASHFSQHAFFDSRRTFLVTVRIVHQSHLERTAITKEGLIMDPHFHEYLAAVAGMQAIYGEPADEGCSEFHKESAEAGEVTAHAAA
jgi:hypothetical protein